jgi:hypothetical protein
VLFVSTVLWVNWRYNRACKWDEDGPRWEKETSPVTPSVYAKYETYKYPWDGRAVSFYKIGDSI